MVLAEDGGVGALGVGGLVGGIGLGRGGGNGCAEKEERGELNRW
jgi:hypothetical protein